VVDLLAHAAESGGELLGDDPDAQGDPLSSAPCGAARAE
jgi:hypothetical protein